MWITRKICACWNIESVAASCPRLSASKVQCVLTQSLRWGALSAFFLVCVLLIAVFFPCSPRRLQPHGCNLVQEKNPHRRLLKRASNICHLFAGGELVAKTCRVAFEGCLGNPLGTQRRFATTIPWCPYSLPAENVIIAVWTGSTIPISQVTFAGVHMSRHAHSEDASSTKRVLDANLIMGFTYNSTATRC